MKDKFLAHIRARISELRKEYNQWWRLRADRECADLAQRINGALFELTELEQTYLELKHEVKN